VIQQPLTYPHPQVYADDGEYRLFVRGGGGGHLVHVAKGNRFLCVPGFYLFTTDIILESMQVRVTCKECAKRWQRRSASPQLWKQ
jgi:hypothetical protein